MKRILFFTLFTLHCSLFTLHGETSTVENTTYSFNITSDNTATLTGVDYWDGTLIIPSTLYCDGKAYRVTAIGSDAFEDASNLSSLILSEGLETIESGAFNRCRQLLPFILPNSLTTIQPWAFVGCESLTSLDLSETQITVLDDYAFSYTSLQYITLPQGLTTIGQNAFTDCATLLEINFPSSLRSIGANAFLNCYALQNISFSEGLQTIGESAFCVCGSLLDVTLPSTLTSLAPTAFAYCYNLNSIDLSASHITTISDKCFAYCQNLKDIKLPLYLTKIDNAVFLSCTGLQRIYLPQNLTTIGLDVFRDCTGLQRIYFPPSLTSIQTYAFVNCESLETVDLSATHLTYLGTKAFENCTKLKRVAYPVTFNTTTSNNVFVGDFALTDIILVSPAGTTSFTFGPIENDYFVYVPDNAINSYINSHPTFLRLRPLSQSSFPFSIYYSANGGSNPPESADACFGEPFVLPASIPTRAGYIFDGWHTHPTIGSPYAFGSLISGSVMLYAHWYKSDYSYTYNYTYTGKAAVTTSASYKYILNPLNPLPSNPGYTFDGWYTDSVGGTKYNFPYAVSGVDTLYAHWKTTLTYYTSGSTGGPQNSTILCGTTISQPAPPVVPAGYAFAGWYNLASGGTKYTFPLTITKPLFFHAHWAAQSQAITYDLHSGTATGAYPATVIYGNTMAEPSPKPTRSGYLFDGWHTLAIGGSKYTFPLTITEPTTLHAHWINILQTVTYNANGGNNPPANTNIPTGSILPPPNRIPTRSGYAFDGWHTHATNNTPYDFTKPITGSITLYAHWSVIVTLHFGYQADAFTNVPYGGILAQPANPIREGHTFGGWYSQSEAGTQYAFPIQNVIAPFTLYARWTGLSEAITYDTNGGSNPPENTPLPYNGILTEPSHNPSRTGYTFTGWYSTANGGSKFTFPRTVTGPLTLYAHWTPILQAITYDVSGGQYPNTYPSTVLYDKQIFEIDLSPVPTRDGYIFENWCNLTDGYSPITFPYTVTGPLTLFAQWKLAGSTGLNVTGDSSTIDYYDLQGHRVSHPENGRLYLIIYGNGTRQLIIKH